MHQSPTAPGALFGPVQQALNELDTAFGKKRKFDPAAAEQTLRIGMNDIMSLILLPTLVERVSILAPNIDLRFIHTLSIVNKPHIPSDPLLDLDSGRTDVCIIQNVSLGQQFVREKIFTVDYVCVTSAGNDQFNPPIDTECYHNHGHVMVSYSDADSSRLDSALAKQNLVRNVKARVPLYTAAVATASQTNLIHTMPRILLPLATKLYQLKVSELPAPSPTSDYFLVWHKTRTSDPAHIWLRQILRECIASIMVESGTSV